MTDDLLNPVQAGDHLKTKGINHGPGRLANLRAEGKGPEFQRLGKWIRYRRRALDRYAESLLSKPMRSTREPAVPANSPEMAAA